MSRLIYEVITIDPHYVVIASILYPYIGGYTTHQRSFLN